MRAAETETLAAELYGRCDDAGQTKEGIADG